MRTTDKIKISNTGSGMNYALNLTEHFSESLHLDRKTSSRMRLLTEEMLCMVRAIAGSFTSEFYITEDDGICKLCLEAKSDLDYKKRKDLLSASTTGKNIASVGIMEKIRNIFEAGLYSMEESFNLQAEYGGGFVDYGMMDMGVEQAVYAWSMQKYKQKIDEQRQNVNDTAALDAWDELEKSIIANIADEVEVGVKKDSVELIVTKKIV